MNENKIKLILLVASLSDESCANILSSIYDAVLSSRPMAINNVFIANTKTWDESEHPRHDDGRFAPEGSMRSQMLKREAKKWDDTGKMNPNPNRSEKLKSLKKEIEDLKKEIEYGKKYGHVKYTLQSEDMLFKKLREYAEAVREWKHSERLKIESGVDKRIMKRKAKEFYDLEADIDYIQEKYGDELGGELKFPKGKRGQKAKDEYEAKLKRHSELKKEIDWDMVEDDEEE